LFVCGLGIWTQDLTLTKQAVYCLSHTSSPFCSGYFGYGILWTICPGWPWTVLLTISVSQVARITGMSQQYSASGYFWDKVSLFAQTDVDHDPPFCASCHH
jgi:hypothetical protein